MRKSTRNLTALLVGAAAFFGAVDSASAGLPYLADGRIKKLGGPAHGNDIYNNNGQDQTVERSGPAGQKRKFAVQGQNDGELSDRMGFNASSNDETGYSFKFKKGSRNITAKVLGSGYKSPVLAPGAKHSIVLIVKILGGANAQLQVYTDVDSIRDGDTTTDTVFAITADSAIP